MGPPHLRYPVYYNLDESAFGETPGLLIKMAGLNHNQYLSFGRVFCQLASNICEDYFVPFATYAVGLDFIITTNQ